MNHKITRSSPGSGADGWGLLLMDQLIRQRGGNPAQLTPLDRLAFMGAYDLTYINGHHSMSIMGHGQQLPKQQIADLIPLSSSKVNQMIEEVSDALSQWYLLSREHGVPIALTTEISNHINGEINRLKGTSSH